MKKYIFMCGALVALGVGRASWAATIACMASHCMDLDAVTVNDVSAGCQRIIKTCYGNYALETCVSCATGYTNISASAVVPGCVGTYTYSDCQENCAGCVNCVSDASWSGHAVGYEKKVVRTCDCNTCKATTSYRCAAGYYGSSLNGTTGCTRCPENGNSNAGTTSVTGCYVTSGSDATGSCIYTQNCYYSN